MRVDVLKVPTDKPVGKKKYEVTKLLNLKGNKYISLVDRFGKKKGGV